MTTTSYSEARAHLAELLDHVVQHREPGTITRRGHEPVALVAADEWDALLETVRLLRSRTNAERLLGALARVQAGQGTAIDLATLRAELGLADE